ncbi:terpene synthase family protein [Streptomyces sp. NPDC056257]|uniref:terpene synthase family protein n=1 Tax=Streptomyces sp. NPDC056257 TaxID=3345765 RepID=UPI0035D8F2E5
MSARPAGMAERLSRLLYAAEHPAAPLLPRDPVFAAVRDLRLHSGAVDTFLPFLEHAHGIALAPAERHDPRLEALTEMAAFLIGWANDVLSYRKESTRRGRRLDVVTLLRRNGADLGEAVATAVGQYDRVMCRFLELGERAAAAAPGPGGTWRPCTGSCAAPQSGSSPHPGTGTASGRASWRMPSATAPAREPSARWASPHSNGGGTPSSSPARPARPRRRGETVGGPPGHLRARAGCRSSSGAGPRSRC